MDKLDVCNNTRKIAADFLFNSLKELLKQKKPLSEATLRNRWLLELRKHKDLAEINSA